MQDEPQDINILIVDDNAKNLLALEAVLQAPDRKLVRAASGNEALRYLLAHDVAVILLDVFMPGIDGFETASLIRGRQRSRDTPIIFLTANNTGNTQASQGYTLGAVDFILKPVEPDVLRSKVAVFVELFKKTRQVKRQAELLREKNIELENANLQRLSKLIDLGQQLAAERDPAQLLEKFCDAACDIVGAQHAAVVMLDGDGKELRHCRTCSLDPAAGEKTQGEVCPAAASSSAVQGEPESILATLLTERHPIRLCKRDAGLNEASLLSAHYSSIGSFLGAPILSPTQVYGWMYLADKLNAEEFSEADERLAVTLAAQVAVTYENARLYTEAQSTAAKLKREVVERQQLEEQLRQSQKMEAVGQLAGGVAHDFNNLLAVITGYSDLLLLRLPQSDASHEKISQIRRAADHAASLTRQLLAFSRQQVLQPRILDLNTVVSDMNNMLRRLINENINLETVLSADLGHVKVDPSQVEQVLMNLVVNARDAMNEGGKLTIETTNVTLDEAYAHTHFVVQPGKYVMLAVSDTGCGMDAETQERIFEPFFTTKQQGKGTGLGLSTVYGIVKQSGGYIWVYSEVEWGTTFKVYLPLVEEEVEELQASVVPTDSLQGSETVLLVEDEEMVRKMTREVLQMYGYQVLEAANGGQALALCEQYGEEIHLMLTDVVMPQMSGRELAKRLAPVRSKMHVLYMSGYTDDAIVHHGVLDADTAFLQKPFTPELLARKVREVLDSTG